MAHYCKSILFHCMDFRLIKETIRWMQEKNYLGDCDVISLAGASKEIVDGSAEVRNLLLKQIEISSKLHKADQVILLHHSDCGAYKAAYNFASPEEEKKKQLSDMQKAEKIIKGRFSEIRVIKIWAEMKDPEGNKINCQKK